LTLDAIPSEPGTYALILTAARPRRIQVGSLGKLAVRTGCYVYVGSALGPGGLRGRLSHHLRVTRRPHWHLDYLRRVARPVGLWYCLDAVRREHDWAGMLLGMPGSSVALRRFGASDCLCETHLVFFASAPAFQEFQRRSAAPMHDLLFAARSRGSDGATAD